MFKGTYVSYFLTKFINMIKITNIINFYTVVKQSSYDYKSIDRIILILSYIFKFNPTKSCHFWKHVSQLFSFLFYNTININIL